MEEGPVLIRRPSISGVQKAATISQHGFCVFFRGLMGALSSSKIQIDCEPRWQREYGFDLQELIGSIRHGIDVPY